MTKLICLKCTELKELSEYNKNSTINICKICSKKPAIYKEYSSPYIEQLKELERKRQRDKYHRLGYKDKHKPTPEKKKEIIERYQEKYPEKNAARNRASNIKPIIKGNQLHHWSYNEIHFKDTIEMTKLEHNLLHRFMIYDQEKMMYRTLDGVLLDTKKSHTKYFELIKLTES